MKSKDLMEVLADHDAEMAEVARNHAIDVMEAKAKLRWKDEALAAVMHLAATRAEFTTDDVWALVQLSGEHTHEPRAMGAVMRQAARDGAIAKTDRVVNSARPVTVWRSLHRLAKRGGR